MKWSDEYKVHYYYTDYNNILKPGYIARYMQETAWNALKNWGPSPEYLSENKLGFILSKISFKYYQEIREDDIIKVETWAVPPSKSVVFVRNYRIYNKGEIAVEASSMWALMGMMDMQERAVLKPEVLGDNFKGFDDEELSFGVQRRFKFPEHQAEISEYNEYKVKYADIDTYYHMNNVAYIDLVNECLYNDNEKLSRDLKKKILSLDLNYNSEAVFGDVIKLNKIINCEEIYITGEVNNKNCFEAKVVIKV